MTEKQKKRVWLIYGALLSAVIIIAGICLMAACIDIYRSGDHPYSREAVAAHFGPIAAPVFLCLAMVLGGFVLNLVLPAEQSKPKAGRQDALILKRLHEKADLSQCDASLRAAVAVQQKRRKICRTVCAVVMALCALIFLIYALDGSHFLMPDINGSMIRAMGVLLPCLAAAFGCAVFHFYFSRASIRAEIALLKQAPVSRTPAGKEVPAAESCGKRIAVLRCAILAAGIGLLLYGFFAGGTADVLTKAINICTECVGLG